MGKAQTISSLTLSPSTVAGGAVCDGQITLSAKAGAGGVAVTLSSSNPGLTLPSSLIVASGTRSKDFIISTDPVASPATAQLTASAAGSSASATLSIQPAVLFGVAVYPPTAVGGSSVSAGVSFTGPVATAQTVVLMSNSPHVKVPASVTVAAGMTAASFTVATTEVSNDVTATITAQCAGVSQSTPMTVFHAESVASMAFTPSTLMGGQSTELWVTLAGPAGPNGVVIKFTSDSPAVKAPPSVTIPASSYSTWFDVLTTPVRAAGGPVVATITASTGVGPSCKAKLTVTPTVQMTMSPSQVLDGRSSTGTVKITGGAPEGGIAFSLSSNSPDAAVPAKVTIPAGSDSTEFTVQTAAATSPATAIITANVGSALSASAKLNVATGLAVQSVNLSAISVVGGTNAYATVSLNVAAPSGGLLVSLSTTDSTLATAPATVTIPEGQTSAVVAITTYPVTVAADVSVFATYSAGSGTAPLTISPGLPGITYRALDPSGWEQSSAIGASDGLQGGSVSNSVVTHAALWHGSATSFVDMNPPNWAGSVLTGLTEEMQVGSVSSATETHAALWRGDAASFKDLNPTGSPGSAAYGISGSSVVGFYKTHPKSLPSEPHAALWEDGKTLVNLNPSAWTQSTALAVDGDLVVGEVGPNGFLCSAAAWTSASADSFVDLTPLAAGGQVTSVATGVSGQNIVGWVQSQTADPHEVNYPAFAGIWTSLNGANFQSLNPAVALGGAYAYGVSGNIVVGVVCLGVGFDYVPLYPHAAIWFGNASSYVDLEAAVGANWAWSAASAVYSDTTGFTVVGSCDEGAVEWHIPATGVPQG